VATQVNSIIGRARNMHPAFHVTRVPNVPVLAYLSELQRKLITKGATLDANRVAVTAAIAFATTPGNVPASAGAGSSGALPGTLVAGALTPVYGDAGPSIELDLVNAAVLMADTPVLSATPTAVTFSGTPVPGTVDGNVAWVVAGTGVGTKRFILSHTTSSVTVSTGSDGLLLPLLDTTSIVRILTKVYLADNAVNLVTELPPQLQSTGYLVQINALGVPFINLVNPVTVSLDNGIPLPNNERVLGGSCHFKSGTPLAPITAPLAIRPYAQRHMWGPGYAAWLENNQLFLVGGMQDWADVISIDLRLVPIAPDFVLMTDALLVPDNGLGAMVAGAARFMASRCAGMPDVIPSVDTATFADEFKEALGDFLESIGGTARAQKTYVKEVW
jgi:hypothetical protein